MSEPAPDDARDTDYQLGPADFVLGFLTLPLLLFALMFITSQQAHTLEAPRSRRKLLLILLAIELVGIALIVWAVAG